MLRSLLARVLLSLVPLALVLALVAPRAFGVGTGPAIQVIANPQAAPAAAVTQLYHPSFLKASFGFSSTVVVQNLGTAAANTMLDFYSGSGVAFSFTPNPIPAGGVASIGPAELSGLPAGFQGTMILSSDQPVQSLVLTRASAGTDRMLSYSGIPASEAATSLYFGPFTKSGSGTSGVVVQNVGTASANLNFTVIDASGVARSVQAFSNLAPGGVVQLIGANIAELPSGFSGYVQVTSDTPLVGLTLFDSAALRWARPAMAEGLSNTGARAFVPRFFYSASDAGGVRSTRLSLVNLGASAANATVEITDLFGILTMTRNLTIPARGIATFDPIHETAPGLAPGLIASAVVSSDQPLGVTELTTYDSAPARASDADSYTLPGLGLSDTMLRLPQVAFGSGERTNVYAQNVGPQTSLVTLSLTTGIALNSNVPPGATARFNASSGVPGSYSGPGVVTSVSPVTALVDIEGELLPPPATATATAPPATQVPTPTTAPEPARSPALYLNYVIGAAGSVFVVRGYNFPANVALELRVNGEVALSLSTDASGSFSLVLRTPPDAMPGFYVVTVLVRGTTSAALTAASAQTIRFGSFQLVDSGPDAVVRTAPPDAPVTSADVPPAAAANPLTSPPYGYLPLIAR